MRVLTWNLRRATKSSKAWQILDEANADILFLQEVGKCPDYVLERYDHRSLIPRTKSGNNQEFSTAILSKYKIIGELDLSSEFDWVNREFNHYTGNILGCQVSTENGQIFNIVCVYSPAWNIPKARLVGVDVSKVKLVNNPDIYCTEILWSLLKNTVPQTGDPWIVAGDFNSSPTFDWMWGPKPRGNQEFIKRMNDVGLTDCLSDYVGELVPTFQNSSDKRILHQLDYIYVSENLRTKLVSAEVFKKSSVLIDSVSDHFPIVCVFS